jgi:pimeloyl-ACP methyl ester carboxylesterase
MSFVDRDGTSIYYEDHGEGPAVLLTHGFSSTCRMWDPQIDALAGGYRVILWDMRGHGESDSPADPSAYSHDLSVGDMAAVMEACGITSAVIGGLSLGGFLSLCFQYAHPRRTDALLLCDTGPGYRDPVARAEWNRYAEKIASGFEAEGLGALWDNAEVSVASHSGAQGLALAARGILAQHDARIIDSLPDVRVPTLVVAGSEDTLYVKSMGYMVSKIPNAESLLVEGAGHAPNIDRPETFNAEVGRFLDRLTV